MVRRSDERVMRAPPARRPGSGRHSGRAAARLACAALALLAAAGHGQAAFAQLEVESAHYWVSDGAVDVRLDGPISWVNPQGVRLVGADGQAFVAGTVFHSGDTMSITLGDARGDFEGLEHPRYVVVRAGGINGTDGAYNADEIRVAISYSDTAPPQISSAGYDAGTGVLNASFSEAAWSVNAEGVRAYGSDGAAIAVVGVRHGQGDDVAYVDLEPGAAPATLSISAGGVTDIWGNANAADLSRAVHVAPSDAPATTPVNGTQPPNNGTIVQPPVNGATPPVNGTQPPNNGTIVQPPVNGATPPVNGTQPPNNGTIVQPPVNGTVTPPVNGTQPPNNGTIVQPPIRVGHPSIASAIYDTDRGRLGITVGNATGSLTGINASKFGLAGAGGADACGGNCTAALAGNATISVYPDDAAEFEGVAHPRYVTVGAGGLSDQAGPTTSEIRAPISYSDTSPPSITSAVYNIASGVLAMNLSERTQLAPASVTLEGSLDGALAPKNVSHTSGSDMLTVTLSGQEMALFENMTHPRTVRVAAGGVADAWGNANGGNISHAISYAGDTTPPAVVSAVYDSNGALNVTLDERAAPVGHANVVLHSESADIKVAAGELSHAPRSNFFIIQLSEDRRAAFDLPAPPPAVTVSPGGLEDIWGNANENTMTFNSIRAEQFVGAGGMAMAEASGGAAENTKPTVVVVRFHPNDQHYNLKITFSEPVTGYGGGFRLDVYDGTTQKFWMYKNNCGNTFASAKSTHICTVPLSHFLNIPNYAQPLLEIPTVGSISNAQNQNLEKAKHPIIMYESTKPTFGNASYYDYNGTVRVNFSEKLFAANGSKLHIQDSSGGSKVTLTGAAFAGNTVTATLSSGNLSTVNGFSTPQIDIDSGAVTDMSGNLIDAATNQAITKHVRPTITGAQYYTGNGALNVTFSATLDTALHDASKMHLRDTGQSTGVTLSRGMITVNGTDSIKFDLNDTNTATVNAMASPRIVVDAGAVTDSHGNSIAAGSAAVNVTNTNRPEFVDATYYYHEHVLNVTFDKQLSAVNASGILINNQGRSVGCAFSASNATISNDTVTLTLGWLHDKFLYCAAGGVKHVKLDIREGAVSDAGNRGISAASNLTFSIVDNVKPRFVSAVYYAEQRELNVVFTEYVFHDGITHTTFMYVRDVNQDSGGVTLRTSSVLGSGATYGISAADAATIAGYQRAQLDIDARSISDLNSNYIGSSANHNITVHQTKRPVLNSATYYTGNGSLVLDFTHYSMIWPDRLHVHDANSSTKLDLGTPVVYTSVNNTAWFELKDSVLTAFNGYAAPQLDVASNAVTGNQLYMNATSNYAITVVDTTKPTFQSASYYTGNGSIAMRFSEVISSADHSKIHIRDTGSSSGGITLSAVTVSGSTLNATLSAAQRTSLDSMTTPQVDMDAGAVRDPSGNLIGATNDRTLTEVDTAGPTVTTIQYQNYGSTPTIRVSFSERLNQTASDGSKFHFRASGSDTGGLTMPATISANDHRPTYIDFDFDTATDTAFGRLLNPQLDLDAEAVQDALGNPNAAQADILILSNFDWAAPKFTDATYYSNGTLLVQFSEVVNATMHDASKIHVRDTGESTGGVTLSNGVIVQNGTYYLKFNLASADANTVNSMGTPQLDIDAGAVRDVSSNQNQILAASDRPITVVDTLKPTFSSATFATGSGVLKVTFSEALNQTTHDASKMHIRNAGESSGGVTLSNAMITTNGTNSITFTLSNTHKGTVNAMAAPQLDIEQGAVQDAAGNLIAAAADQAITVNDTIKPAFSSATFTTGSGVLKVTFSEALNQTTHDASKMHIRNAGESSGGVTLSNAMITTNGTNSITFTLNSTNRDTVNGLAAPQLDIEQGAVQDAAGNLIAAAADQAITVNDTIKPAFSSATFTTGSGVLKVTFSENLNQTTHDASKMHIRNAGESSGGVTLSNAMITTNGTNSITFTLNSTNRDTVNGLAAPQLDIEQGAVQDAAGNLIAAASDQAITVNDTIKPAFSSATFTTGSGVLKVTFSENLNQTTHDASKMHIRNAGESSGGVTLSNAMITTNGTNSITFTLNSTNRDTVNGLAAPQLDIEQGAVQDAAGNLIAAASDQAITVNDTIKPAFSSATFTTGSGVLKVTFSENLNQTTHDASKMHIRNAGESSGGVTLSNAMITTNGTNSITFTLNSTNRDTVNGLAAPQLDIEQGAVQDAAGNLIAAASDQAITVNDTIKPAFSSATFTTGSGVLKVTFSENLNQTTHDASKMHIRNAGESSGGVTLSNAMITTNGTNSITFTLNSTNRDTVNGLAAPQLDIDAGAVRDTSGNLIAAASDQAITVNDTLKPTVSSVAYSSGSGVLTVTFSENLNQTTHDASKMHIRNAGESSGGVTLSNAMITTNGTNSITFTLNSTNRDTVNGLAAPQLDIDAGAVRDTSGNLIAAASDQAITVNDTLKPTVSSVAYSSGSGVLTVTFSENLNQTTHDASKMHIRNAGESSGGVTLSNAMITTNGTNSITFTLNSTNRDTVNGLAAPQLDIDAGAVRDTSGNLIAAASDQAITVNDTLKPTVSSVAYSSGSGVLTVTFSENLNQTTHDASKMHIRNAGESSGGVTLSNAMITTNGTNSITFTLNSTNRDTVNGLAAPQLDIEQGAVQDAAGNLIAAASDQAITVNDTIKPAFSSATFTTGSGVLKVTFSENLNQTTHDASKMHIRNAGESSGGVTLSNAMITTNGTNSITFTLNSTNRDTVNGLAAPQLDIDAGAVRDTSGNLIAAASDQAITVNDTLKPTVSSVAYSSGSGVLTVTFSENLNQTTHDASKMHIRNAGESSGGVTLSNAMITTNGTNSITFTLNSTNRDTVNGLAAPQLDIDAGAVRDTSGNLIAAASDQAITVNDTLKPTVSSVAYSSGSGVLTVTFSENLNQTTHDASKMHIRNAGESSGGVTLSNAMITTNGTNSITFTLNSTNRDTVNGLAAPQLDIDAGAVRDTSGNLIAAASDQAITVNDTLKPTVSSVAYSSGSGVLTVTFSENLNQTTHDASKMHVRNAGESSGGVTLSNSMITANGTNSITFTLSNTHKGTVNAMAAPQLDIDAGAVRDTSGNLIAAASDQAITVNDTILPTFSSATFATGSGVLTVTFSENLNQTTHDASKMHVRNAGESSGGVTLSNAMITANGTNSITFTLNSTNRDTVNGLAAPQLDIDAGAVRDTSGNLIAAASDQAITVNDTILPTFSSATFATGSGVLTVTFSENLNQTTHDASKMHVRNAGESSGGVTLSNSMITANGTNSITFTLNSTNRDTVNGLAAPQLDIDAGAVRDTSGNEIAAAADQSVTVNDTILPTFSSATFATGSGVLTVTFSENLNQTTHDASKMHVRNAGQSSGGVTLSNAMITANGTNSITFTLSNTHKGTVNAMAAPQLDIDAGAVRDTSGNEIAAAADQSVTVNDTILPTFSSATFATGSGVLTVTFSENLNQTTHDASKMHVRNAGQSSGGVTLSNAMITANGTNSITFTLSNTHKGTVNAMAAPQLDIDAGAVRDTSGNEIAAAADQSVTVNDTILPTFSSATFATGSGVLTVTFSENLNQTTHDASKMHVRNAGQSSGGVTLSNAMITANGTNSITFTLSNTHKGTVNAMAAAQLDIEQGAVQDTAGNLIAASPDQAVTVNDTVRPTFSSATFATGTGVLTVTFSEALNQTVHDASKIHVRNTGQSSGGVTLSNAMITTNGTDSITFTLDSTNRDAVNNMATPQLDIDAGAVRDTSGNEIAAAADQSVTVNDTILPTFSSATFATGSGVLTVTFSENLNQTTHDASKMHVRNTGQSSGGVTLSNAMITANGTDSITFTLSNTHKGTVNAMAAPQLDIEQGAVQDTAGNLIAASPDQAVTVNDTVLPAFSSATFATGSGVLTVTFSEALDQTTHDASKIHVRNTGQSSGGVTLSNAMITTNGTDSITFTLSNTHKGTVNAMAAPQLDIEQGAVQDTAGNLIAASPDQAVTVNDTVRPTFSSATFATGSGVLTITFSEALNQTTHDASKIHVRNTGQSSGGVTLSNAMITTNGTNSITFDISPTNTATVNNMAAPQLDIEQGAVQDTAGNLIAASPDQAVTVNDTVLPAFSSATFATGSGVLTVTFSEALDQTTHDASKIHVRNTGQSSGGVTLSNSMITTNGTNSITFTISTGDKDTVNNMATPQLDIDAAAVRDSAGNQIAAAADQAITVNDTVLPAFSSATYRNRLGRAHHYVQRGPLDADHPTTPPRYTSATPARVPAASPCPIR